MTAASPNALRRDETQLLLSQPWRSLRRCPALWGRAAVNQFRRGLGELRLELQIASAHDSLEQLPAPKALLAGVVVTPTRLSSAESDWSGLAGALTFPGYGLPPGDLGPAVGSPWQNPSMAYPFHTKPPHSLGTR